jgi:hypothetical protein
MPDENSGLPRAFGIGFNARRRAARLRPAGNMSISEETRGEAR